MTDYYATLGVERGANAKEIKDAYRRLARQYHPDVNLGDKRAEEKFKQVNEAHHVLSEPKSRKDYDEYGERWKHAAQFREAGASPGARAGGFEFRGSPGGAGFGGFEDLFSRFGLGNAPGDGGRVGVDFGGGPFAQARSATPEVKVEIALAEAFAGATRLITFERSEPCGACAGTGRRGRGRCTTCQGAGGAARQARLEVKIPAGIEDGGRVRIRPSEDSELILAVTIRKDPRFRREGADLHSTVEVPYLDAMLGGEVVVPTMTGQIALKIPPGTLAGKTFRIGGKGMPARGSGEQGSLYVAVAVTVPAEQSDEERTLLGRLRELRNGAG